MTLRELLGRQIEFNEALYKLVTRDGVNEGTSMEDFEERSERLAHLDATAQRKMREFKAAAYMFIRTLQ